MTSAQIELVQSSFDAIKPRAEETGKMFYNRVFELHPALRAMFPGGMTPGGMDEQGRKLMQILGVAVSSLRRLEQVIPEIEDLGRRHAIYGVNEDHYIAGGGALIWTLNRVLGEAFTPEVQEAWQTVYHAVTTTMMRGAMMAQVPAAQNQSGNIISTRPGTQ
jgi:hemoglobin-like flavoprotein